MAYTKEFIEEVKRVYPKSKVIIKMAENGDHMLGRYLNDSTEYCGVPANFILEHSYEEIVSRAKWAKAKENLYLAWINGSAYVGGMDREHYCPVNHMQNSNDPDRDEFAKKICADVKYVGWFPSCERYGNKGLCWKKYDELKKEKEKLKA